MNYEWSICMLGSFSTGPQDRSSTWTYIPVKAVISGTEENTVGTGKGIPGRESELCSTDTAATLEPGREGWEREEGYFKAVRSGSLLVYTRDGTEGARVVMTTPSIWHGQSDCVRMCRSRLRMSIESGLGMSKELQEVADSRADHQEADQPQLRQAAGSRVCWTAPASHMSSFFHMSSFTWVLSHEFFHMSSITWVMQSTSTLHTSLPLRIWGLQGSFEWV